jgi:hypothetical protein
MEKLVVRRGVKSDPKAVVGYIVTRNCVVERFSETDTVTVVG